MKEDKTRALSITLFPAGYAWIALVLVDGLCSSTNLDVRRSCLVCPREPLLPPTVVHEQFRTVTRAGSCPRGASAHAVHQPDLLTLFAHHVIEPHDRHESPSTLFTGELL